MNVVSRGRAFSWNRRAPSASVLLAAALLALAIGSARAETLRVADGVYVMLGSGGEPSAANRGRTANVAFVVGSRGVAVVDTGISYQQGEDVIAEVAKVSRLPIVIAILTYPGQEVIFGAAAFQARGIPVLAHRRNAELIAARCETCLRNLRSVLGEDVMAGTRVPTPDRLIDRGEVLRSIGRPLRLIAAPWTSAPGAIAVFDEASSTLMAGSLVLIDRIPDIRDANPKPWRETLAKIRSLDCRHLIPGFGPPGNCADIDRFSRYLWRLENRVSALLSAGVGLAELGDRCELPEFAQWDQYDSLHRQNANRTYLRLEKSLF